MTMDRFSNTLFLSNDIWVTLTVKVASNSIQNLCSLRITCKAARDAGDADIVHRSVSIPPRHATPWWWSRDTEAMRFFDRCMAARHPELLCFSILNNSWPGEVQMPHIEEQYTMCASPRCSTRGHMGLLYDYRRRTAE
ncbi:hypothetical protein Ahy_B01g056955 [Arachis hypogaea]|uniref:Uncharacterized protein n=1 Tax=Arachis hypogaea TaxID=3818 RepID=A0A445AZV5_ARAHY|nr:hypothetical protein Ahy_B01g056955 [Arachis hypogaea]